MAGEGGDLRVSTTSTDERSAAIQAEPKTAVTDGGGAGWTALGAIGLGYLLVSWGMAPISAILPTIAVDLAGGGASNGSAPAPSAATGQALAAAGWVMNGYFLLVVASVLIAGRLGDVLGHRRVFRAGIVAFGLGALASASAPGLASLVVSRGLQGLGAALVYGTSLALVADVLPGGRRGLAVGVVTMSASVASFLGVGFSAYAVEQLSWRWAFWIQVPLALVALASTTRLPAAPASAASALGVLRRIDWRGGLLLFAALTVGTLSLDHVHEGEQSFRDGAAYHLPMHALALLLVLAFARVESIVANPLLRLRMLRDGRFAASVFANGVAHMSMLSAGFVIPFLLERGRGFEPSATRDTLVLIQAATLTCSVGAGWLYDRRPSPLLHWLTFGGIAGGLLLLGLVGGSLPYGLFVATAALLGASQGAFSTVNNAAVIGAAAVGERGSAAGMLETTRHLGHSLGVSLSSGMLESLVAGAAAANLADAYLRGFEQASLAMAALAGLGVLAIVWSQRRPAAPLTARPPQTAP
jgi:DHA2 family multidrug resistance protein-like MFS transporter